MNNRVTIIFVGILVILALSAGYLFLLLSSKKNNEIQNVNKPRMEEIANITRQPINTPTPATLPYDYKVTKVEEHQVIATTQQGNITIPNDPRVQVFIGNPDNHPVPARFADIKLGDMLILKRVPKQAAFVYIVNR